VAQTLLTRFDPEKHAAEEGDGEMTATAQQALSRAHQRIQNQQASTQVSQNGSLLSRRGRSLLVNASTLDTHRDSIISRFDCRPAPGPSPTSCCS
jgi:hypothetical protein